MPCTTATNITRDKLARMQAAIARLDLALAARTVAVVISPQGAVAFRNWIDNEGVSDLCAYRKLLATNSPGLRRAIARAEVMAGRTIDARQVATGTHSHDGGATWSRHT